jgi:hypothetical protein
VLGNPTYLYCNAVISWRNLLFAKKPSSSVPSKNIFKNE